MRNIIYRCKCKVDNEICRVDDLLRGTCMDNFADCDIEELEERIKERKICKYAEIIKNEKVHLVDNKI